MALEKQSRLVQNGAASEGADEDVLLLCKNGKSDYVLVYCASDPEAEKLAGYLQSEILRICGAEPELCREGEAQTPRQVLLGSGGMTDPDFLAAAAQLKEKDFSVSAVGEKLILAALDRESLYRSIAFLLETVFERAVDDLCVFTPCNVYRDSAQAVRYLPNLRWQAYLYRKLFAESKTTNAWDLAMQVSPQGVADQQLCDSLIRRLGASAVFMLGKQIALQGGRICKGAGHASAVQKGSDYFIPGTLADATFGAWANTGESVSLAWLAEQKGWSLYTEQESGLLILRDPQTADLGEDHKKHGAYTNRQYKDRMLAFFSDPARPEPKNETEQSRVVIEDAVDYFYPRDYRNFETRPIYINYYSPGILNMSRGGKQEIYATCEHCRTCVGLELGTETVFYRSTDGGKSWRELTRVPGVRWGVLFSVEETVYMLASKNTGGVVLCRLEADETVTVRQLRAGETSLFMPLIEDGIVYLPCDFGVLSAPVASDLMDPASWSCTPDSNEFITPDWFRRVSKKELGPGGSADLLEGNAIKGPDGRIYLCYRIESQPNGNYAVMLRLSKDRTRYELLEDDRSLLNFPTAISRFGIRFDPVSGLYICLSSLCTVEQCCRARNVLGLSVSEDLFHWRVVDTLLVDREMINNEFSCWSHAFQYIAWDFDGEDLILTVREATGMTSTFHDGKYFTFYRVPSFRELI